ncbi:juvenile hormone acid O-methyltransferase-like isoform X2 [Dermacentor albipictus]|uniref:juvenile hormone acid O-methyltransferase-like isoform X2 n=1 Tax=Dermacentor albipictus TaxID=60249 RepID=UPI0038FD327B
MAAHVKSANFALLSKLANCVRMPAKRAGSSKAPVCEALTALQDRIKETDAGMSPRFQADQYALNNRLQRKDSNFVLDFCQPTFLQECHEKMQFLDVGCGTGDFTRECLLPRCQPCRRIVGTDWSLDMIKYAKRHSDHAKIHYQQLDISADVTDFLAINGPFHRIYSFYCLHWVKNQDAALKNIASLLKPEGECLLLFPASNPATAGWKLLAKMDRWAKYSKKLLAYIAPCEDMVEKQEQIDYMRSLLDDAGLTPSIFVIPRMATFDGWTEKDIIGLHMSILPIRQLVSDDELDQLRADVTAIVRELHGPQTDSSRFRMYIIKASKSKS